VTEGEIRPELKVIGVVSRTGGGYLQSEDYKVTAGWGHAGQGGVTMPAKGKAMAREYTPQERDAFRCGAGALSPATRPSGGWEISNGIESESPAARAGDSAPAPHLLGDTTFDIYLNNTAYWSNIPAKVWQYTIGGYQVMKKWLSYRELELLGRPLTPDEVQEVTNMARRIAAIILLQPALDANYQEVKEQTYAWGKAE
jgi:hypothetical protein